jgi:hypothetical protein
MTPESQKLLRDAFAIIDNIPETGIRFGLPCSTPGRSTGDDAVCSPEGWLAQHPDFVARGLSMSKSGSAILFKGEGNVNAPAAAMAQVFGILLDEASRLFGPRTLFAMDGDSALSDKQLWQQRMREYLGTTQSDEAETSRIAETGSLDPHFARDAPM